MKTLVRYSVILNYLLIFNCSMTVTGQSFTLDGIMAYPFPNELVTAKNAPRIAFAINAEGLRNIYVAEGPEYALRKLTNYHEDSGQEISQLQISHDGKWITFVRGGDFGSNWDDELPVNPSFSPIPEMVSIWSIPFEGGLPIKIAEGIAPVIHPNKEKLAYLKNGQIYLSKLYENGPAKIVEAKGSQSDLKWSPDGSKLAFVSHRNDHSFVGIYSDSLNPILWLAPSFHHDFSPVWSPDGNSMAFIRQSGTGGKPDSILASIPDPYTLCIVDLSTNVLTQIWNSPNTMRGSLPTTHGGANLYWSKEGLVFLSYQDGWPHLYRIKRDGSELTCLTNGAYMVEYVSMNSSGTKIFASANTGPDALDIDRRHILEIDLHQSTSKVLTPGNGNEWAPNSLPDGSLVYISAEAQRPPLVVVRKENSKSIMVNESLIPVSFPVNKLTKPEQVIFSSADGTKVHSTLFRSNKPGKQPAIIYVHGGPPRQMLLGWHYSSYYANAYALNQFLASQGFNVLAVNYRLGIGYGYEFHRPPDGGVRGASEYQDIKSAAIWLSQQSFVDAEHIGIYGGSYGGYLTAMALGRDSDIFAAGVDIHGVHDRTINRTSSYLFPNRFEQAPDAELFREIAWKSSPVSSVDSWKSPVMIIHADDDRNVAFSQSTDLVQRLTKKNIEMETMVIVDDTHHFLRFENQKKVNAAVVDFLLRKLK